MSNETKHTPEPWINGAYQMEAGAFDSFPVPIRIHNVTLSGGVEAKANARRIVACVNWCKGIDTEFLEGSAGDIGTLHAQRDELAAALLFLLDTEQMDDDEPPLVEARKQARTALAKVNS